MSSITLRPSAVPEFLKASDFYKSLNTESDEDFPIPAEHFKPNAEVTSDADLTLLLSTMRFWGLSTFTTNNYDYIMENARKKPSDWLSEFNEAFPMLEIAKQVSTSPHKCMSSVAARAESIEFFKHVYAKTGHISSSALSEAAAHGHLANLEFAYQLSGKMDKAALKQVLCSTAAENGHLDCLKFLHTHGFCKDEDTCPAAAGAGHLDCLKYAHERGFFWNEATFKAAIVGGHLACLTYAHNNNCRGPKNATELAAVHGHYECLKFLAEKGRKMTAAVPIAACKKGSIECLHYSLERGCSISVATNTAAVAGGHANCLQLLHEHNCPINSSTIDAALQGKFWECLQFLVTHKMEGASLCVLAALKSDCAEGLKVVQECGKPIPAFTTMQALKQSSLRCLYYLHDQNLLQWAVDASVAATTTGSLPLLRFAHEHGCPLDPAATAIAAKKGRLDILKFLHDHGCGWDKHTCWNAAYAEDLDCLQYAHEHGAPCTEDVWHAAINGISVSCLEYLHEQECIPQSTEPCTESAVWLDGLEFLHEHGYPWDIDTCYEAAENCDQDDGARFEAFDCFTYAAEQGCPWKTVEMARLLAVTSDLEHLEYAHKHGCPWDETVSTAAQNRHKKLRYCVDNGCPISTASMEIYNQNEAAIMAQIEREVRAEQVREERFLAMLEDEDEYTEYRPWCNCGCRRGDYY